MPRRCASAAVAATLTAADYNHPAARAALATVCRVIRQSDLTNEHRHRLLLELQRRDLPILAIDLGC